MHNSHFPICFHAALDVVSHTVQLTSKPLPAFLCRTTCPVYLCILLSHTTPCACHFSLTFSCLCVSLSVLRTSIPPFLRSPLALSFFFTVLVSDSVLLRIILRNTLVFLFLPLALLVSWYFFLPFLYPAERFTIIQTESRNDR